jgi:hypothetical protein
LPYNKSVLWNRGGRIAALICIVALGSFQLWPIVSQAQSIDFGQLIGGALRNAIEAERQRQGLTGQRPQTGAPLRPPPGSGDEWNPPVSKGPTPLALPPSTLAPSGFVVEGQEVGAKADLTGKNADIRCSPSTLFPGHNWCERQRNNGPGGAVSSSSLLLTAGGIVRYANRSLSPANFGPDEVSREVARLSQLFGEQARIMTLVGTQNSSGAIIAVWGKLRLVPLNSANMQALASGESVTTGLLIDYLGNFRTSAQIGKPVYRIVGGPGYIWSANYDAGGSGTLRLTAADLTGLGGDVSRIVESPSASSRTPPSEVQFSGPARLEAPTAMRPIDPQAQPPSSEFSDQGTAAVTTPLTVQNRTSETGIRTVETKGVGDSPEAARHDAARLAVQQVAGVFIDNRRRIELKVSDEKVSEVVNEKLISYTNAYVSKIDVLRTEQKNGTFEVTARIAVAVAPLLKVLQDNAVPTVAFDTASAASTVETLGAETRGAIELYTDLVDKVDALIRVGVGTPKVDPSLPSPPEEAWLRIPLTYSMNEDAAREWRTKFQLFAQRRAEVFFQVTQLRSAQCDLLMPSIGYQVGPSAQKLGFLAEQQPSHLEGVAACFSSYPIPGGLVAECLGRTFFSERRDNQCTPGKPCIRFSQKAAQVRLVVELLDANNDVIYAVRNPFQNFPSLALDLSRREPRGGENQFYNYCVSAQTPFFAVRSRGNALDYVHFGDVLVFPVMGSSIRGYLNLRLPNALISRVALVRARTAKE